MANYNSIAIAAVVALTATSSAQQVASAPCAPAAYNSARMDTSAHPVRVNVGGGSTAITDSTVNLADSKKMRTRNKPVDSTTTARIDIPAQNSDRNAVRANVGNGST